MKRVAIRFKAGTVAEDFAAAYSLFDTDATVSVNGAKATIVSPHARTGTTARAVAREIVEQAKADAAIGSMLNAVAKAIGEGNKVGVELSDGRTRVITPAEAKALAQTHDRLSESSGRAFMLLASENADALDRCIGFAMKHEEID